MTITQFIAGFIASALIYDIIKFLIRATVSLIIGTINHIKDKKST